MQKTLLMAAMAMMACGGLMAADAAAVPDKQKQMEKLGALRGRLMLKLSELPKTLDVNQNGAATAYADIQAIQAKVGQTVQKQLQDENAKAAEVRFQPAIDNLNKKYQKDGEKWIEFTQKDWAAYGKKMAELNLVFSGVSQIFQYVCNLEMAWNNAGFDLDALSDLLARLDNKADDCKTQAMAATSDLCKQVAVWDAFSKE